MEKGTKQQKHFNAAFFSAPPYLRGKQPQKQKLPNEPIFRFQMNIGPQPLTTNSCLTNTKNEPIFLGAPPSRRQPNRSIPPPSNPVEPKRTKKLRCPPAINSQPRVAAKRRRINSQLPFIPTHSNLFEGGIPFRTPDFGLWTLDLGLPWNLEFLPPLPRKSYIVN
jgi:hypothetical protein